MARKRNISDDAATAGDDERELRSSPDVRSGLIPGNTFGAKAVRYAVVDGLALFEGDIVLGTEEEVERRTAELRDVMSGEVSLSVVISGPQFRWPGCRIPYTIDPALPNQQRVTDAIAHWEQHTRFRFVARTTETDFVTFQPAGGCSSAVGRQGGQQFVNLGPNCTAGNAIHEIGHVVGLWHEQSREDRDSFVTIHLDKVMAGFEHNFDQHITDGDDVGAYDYGSIMHYPRDAFSVDGSDTITPVVAGAQIGQRTALSAGDIAAANSFCPKPLKEATKDIRKDPIKEGPRDTVKEQIKDARIDTRKEQIRDTIKEQIKDRKEPILDPRKSPLERPVGPGPIGPGPLGPGGGPVVQPQLGGGPLPFAVATPHQAGAAEGQPGGQLDQTIAELDAQLQLLAEQIAQLDGERATLQAQYDETAALLAQTLAEHEAGQ
jgi:Astacin (Peptidase family M12A)